MLYRLFFFFFFADYSNISRKFICSFCSCVDDSGNWGHGGMFDALAKLSASIPDAYQRATEFSDLHLGDLHLIRINGQRLCTLYLIFYCLLPKSALDCFLKKGVFYKLFRYRLQEVVNHVLPRGLTGKY